MSGECISISNLYPYEKVYQHGPVFHDENKVWYLTRYDHVKLMLTDSRFRRKPPSNHGLIDYDKSTTLMDKIIEKWPIFTDPPEHTPLREIFSIIINPRFIKEMREIIEAAANSLVSTMLDHTIVDYMQAFAYPLPVNIINRLLGTSLDNSTIRGWSLNLVNALDHGTPKDLAGITPTLESMQAYFIELITEREKQPRNDWISELVRIKDTYQLNIEDISSICMFLIIAGHETVQLSLGLGLIALLHHPEQRRLLQNNPELVPSAVEEILRFDSPFSKVSRWTTEKITFDNVVVPENQLIVGLLNAANRDPEKFINPDQFDITRQNNRHLTFGHGMHICLGALMARLELQVGLKALIPHLHKFSLNEDQIEFLPNSSFRYIFKLIINIDHNHPFS